MGSIMKVLVIEDDAQLAAYLTAGLREHNYVVDHASNGRDGLFMAARGTLRHHDH